MTQSNPFIERFNKILQDTIKGKDKCVELLKYCVEDNINMLSFKEFSEEMIQSLTNENNIHYFENSININIEINEVISFKVVINYNYYGTNYYIKAYKENGDVISSQSRRNIFDFLGSMYEEYVSKMIALTYLDIVRRDPSKSIENL